MTPEAVRQISPLIRVEGPDFYFNGKRVDLYSRHNTLYIEALVRGRLYRIPAAMLSYYWHKGEWPDNAVRFRDGDQRNFAIENLYLHRQEAPKVIFVRRLEQDEARAYSGVRTGSVGGGVTASTG